MKRFGLIVLALAFSTVPGLRADTLNVAADARISSEQPTANFGRLPAMTVRRDGEGSVLNGYARFDLSALPAAATVRKAILRLWVAGVVVPGGIEVVPVLSPWQEDRITFENQPALGTPVASFKVAGSQVLHFINVDITGLVNDWASGFLDNHGLALRGIGGAAVDVTFDTKEIRRRAGSHSPELEVALMEAGPSPGACFDGDFINCYTGPAGTRGTGVCAAGTRTCQSGAFGTCVGEVVPVGDFYTVPHPNGGGFDYNCDGIEERQVTTRACYYNSATGACVYGYGWGDSVVPACGQEGTWVLFCDVSICYQYFEYRRQYCR